MGCVSGLGGNVREAWQNARAGVCGISRNAIEAENQPQLVFGGPVAAVAARKFETLVERFGHRAVNSVDRFSNLAALATLEALSDASLLERKPEIEAAAIVYGSASGGNSSIEAGYQRLFDARASSVHPLTIPRYMSSAPTSHLSMLFGVKGLCFSVASACSSSAHAIGEGMHLIRSGRAQIVIVGGSDASLTYGSLHAWRALGAVSTDACRPFSLGRNGTIIGEGAATLVLEEAESAARRGATIYAEVAGYGASSDAAHITKPDVQGAVRAIRAAHSDAQLPTTLPLLISAHGTGTTLNDSCEAAALNAVYGEALQRCSVIATKSAHGHMLGASGAMEFILAVLALRQRISPPVLGFLGKDPECDLPLALTAAAIDYQAAISTSLAFGGLNCVLIARMI
jgi:nodulation protein E